MGSGKYYGALGCIGAAILAGTAWSNAANAQTAVLHPHLAPVRSMEYCLRPEIKDVWRAVGAEHIYIEELALPAEVILCSQGDESQSGVVLLAREQSSEGTMVYANVTNYVNVRKQATTSSDVVGKLYSGCVATVIKDAGNWVYVSSGNVTGYVIKEHLLFFKEAEEAIARKYSPKIKVTANVLNVRSGAGTEYKVLTSFKKGDTAQLLEAGKEWHKIRFKVNGKETTGYVYATYTEVTGEPKYGETLAEEKKRLEREQREAKEAAAKAEAERKAAAEQKKRDKAKQVADYAKTAVGTDYVWGGTNMKTGVDCSGLCYAAYKKYGYTLPRVSRDMAASKNLLSVTPNTSYLKPGDLVFYASGGRVDHVAMYIGNGQVVHASDYDTGVIISRYNYRTPHSAKRVIY